MVKDTRRRVDPNINYFAKQKAWFDSKESKQNVQKASHRWGYWVAGWEKAPVEEEKFIVLMAATDPFWSF